MRSHNTMAYAPLHVSMSHRTVVEAEVTATSSRIQLSGGARNSRLLVLALARRRAADKVQTVGKWNRVVHRAGNLGGLRRRRRRFARRQLLVRLGPDALEQGVEALWPLVGVDGRKGKGEAEGAEVEGRQQATSDAPPWTCTGPRRDRPEDGWRDPYRSSGRSQPYSVARSPPPRRPFPRPPSADARTKTPSWPRRPSRRHRRRARRPWRSTGRSGQVPREGRGASGRRATGQRCRRAAAGGLREADMRVE
jgi:hypothetical protein